MIDLHCHTTASDGLTPPSELVRLAAERAVDVIAVTDHDTLGGIDEALDAARSCGVRVVGGIELSTRLEGRGSHVLGYFLDPSDERLRSVLDRLVADRVLRAQRMVEKLNDLGYEMGFDEVRAHATGVVVARPHIARAMLARGYIASLRDAFTQDLIADGGKAHVDRAEMTPFDAVDLVGSVGGVAVLAHPAVAHHEGQPDGIRRDLIDALAARGLGGLEVDHPDQPPLARDKLRAIADELRLVATGGSDFHGEPGHVLAACTTGAEQFAELENRRKRRTR